MGCYIETEQFVYAFLPLLFVPWSCPQELRFVEHLQSLVQYTCLGLGFFSIVWFVLLYSHVVNDCGIQRMMSSELPKSSITQGVWKSQTECVEGVLHVSRVGLLWGAGIVWQTRRQSWKQQR